ncbi:xylitol oxidase [Pseudonocardia thermophila]|uniref:Xylitol oxidase n=1 Tax=Pseudonocardia thermophila TaxID=1848 RepID=A0A1M6PCC7_PSETH|nr:D-arabinono-1,4-lactone oxidase [Pseudonocardia thermophila]SHK05611.1 xylitol oxidase [Pseudonocardia thermophila]
MVTSNWAGNVRYSARAVHHPRSIAELQELVAGSERVRAVGTGHSFNRIADTEGDLVSVAGLPARIEIDEAQGCVTVGAGMRFGEVVGPLDAAGLALANMGSLPHISVAGACSTGTHGSGDANRVLGAYARAIEVVGADGALRTVRRGEPDFPGSVIALGALGVVTAVTLDVVPAFGVRQWVHEGLTDLDAVDAALSAAYSVSAFTHWAGAGFEQVWLKVRDGDPVPEPGWLGTTPADGPRHMVRGVDPRHCTPQRGEPGPWHARLPHFRLEFTPSTGDELQSEWFLPRELAGAGLRALDAVRETIAPVLQVCEVRSIAADDTWLSPAAGRDTVAFHFTWDDSPAVEPVVAAVDAALEPLGARPHWAKLSALAPAVVRERWPEFGRWAELVGRHDPAGTFRNAYLAALLD